MIYDAEQVFTNINVVSKSRQRRCSIMVDKDGDRRGGMPGIGKVVFQSRVSHVHPKATGFVVTRDNEKCARSLLDVFIGYLNGFIERDGFADGAIDVHTVASIVDECAFNHQEKAIGLSIKDL